MTNFNTLEELRTKEELVNYFKTMGQNISEEDIETLKKSYEEVEENNGALSLEQLDDVAGGGGTQSRSSTHGRGTQSRSSNHVVKQTGIHNQGKDSKDLEYAKKVIEEIHSQFEQDDKNLKVKISELLNTNAAISAGGTNSNEATRVNENQTNIDTTVRTPEQAAHLLALMEQLDH